VPVRGMDVGQQSAVGLGGGDHARPSSLRTIVTPWTRLASFCRAAQRAVWLSPQSGPKDSCSAGAYFRHRRTRPARSDGLSM
jgi:hypothetical protein